MPGRVQTFVPYPSFARSARVLDDRRLGKQRVETLQILRALTWPVYGWKNHPAVTMWRGFTPALVSYGVAVCEEWVARGGADAVRASIAEFTGGKVAAFDELRAQGGLPPWMGMDVVHASHQSSLVRKDPEYYRQFFPDVPDDLPYAWPTPVFPRWPVRRGAGRALDLGSAQALLGLPEVPDEAVSAVVAVQEGESYSVDLPPGPAAAATGLLAGLCTPGWTAWVAPGQAIGPELTLEPPRVRDRAGKLADRIARPPTADDLAAMRAEAEAEPEFRFLRVGEVSADRLRGAGLVVCEGVDVPPDAVGVPVLRLPPPAPPRPGTPVVASGGTPEPEVDA